MQHHSMLKMQKYCQASDEQSLRRPRTESRQLRLAIMSSDALLAGIPESVVDQMYIYKRQVRWYYI